jgi:protein-S-isoprenylcysteine O-methyltransferase Ste14
MRFAAAGGLALSYHVASRLAYVVGVGVALRRQERKPRQDDGATEASFLRFRRLASVLMANDALSFGLVSVLTRHTLSRVAAPTLLVPLGLVLIGCGVAIKAWAARSLGGEAYYWHDFFAPSQRTAAPSGPYRWLKNPMYTVGYAHAYGFALLCGSAAGVSAAAFDQVAILVFNELVEQPHVQRLARAGRSTRSAPG